MSKDDWDYNSSYIKRNMIVRSMKGNGGPVRCFYCDGEFTPDMNGFQNLSIDHILPQSKVNDKEKLHHPDNLVISCLSCNSSKGNEIIEGDDLELFKKERRAQRLADDLWVKNNLFKHAEYSEVPNWENVQSNLLEEMIKYPESFIEPYIYRKHSIKWKNEISGMWQFQAYDYFLYCPAFYGLMKGKDVPDDIIALNFHFGNEFTKLIDMFVDPKEGIEIITRELEAFNKAFKKLV